MEITQIIVNRRSSDIISCDVDTPVRAAAALLAEKRIGALPVMEHGKVVGIFSERDVIYRLASDGEACLARRVGDVMTSPPITVTPKDTVLDALALMTKRRFRHLPVIENETLVGFISIGDLVNSRLEQIKSEAEAMRDYIQTA